MDRKLLTVSVLGLVALAFSFSLAGDGSAETQRDLGQRLFEMRTYVTHPGRLESSRRRHLPGHRPDPGTVSP